LYSFLITHLTLPGKVLSTEEQLFLIKWKKILGLKQSFRSLKMVSKNGLKTNITVRPKSSFKIISAAKTSQDEKHTALLPPI
jgi:hypothetical protein